MPALTIPDLDETTLARLEGRAKAHGRTVEDEARAILSEAAGPTPDEVWKRINERRERLAASGRQFTDSAELLREDRDQ